MQINKSLVNLQGSEKELAELCFDDNLYESKYTENSIVLAVTVFRHIHNSAVLAVPVFMHIFIISLF